MKSKKDKELAEAKKEEEVVTGKENQLSPSSELHGEPSVNEAEIMKPVQDHFPYLGTDSTAVINFEIVSVGEGEEEELDEQLEAANNWLQRTKGSKVDAPTEINAGIEVAKIIAAGYNKTINVTGQDLAERALSLGKIMLRLKPLSKAAGFMWGAWAETNLSFIGKRNREKFMLLASSPDCHEYTFLGVDRLEMLVSATKGSGEADPIKTLLAKYQISYEEEAEVNLGEFKLLVDSAVNSERLIKYGLQVPFEQVKHLTLLGIDFDKSFLRKLKDILECGGNPQAYLEKLSMNRGAQAEESGGDKRLQDFNTLSSRLIRSIDYLLQDEDQLSKVDTNTINRLWEKLVKLREIANPTEQNQPA